MNPVLDAVSAVLLLVGVLSCLLGAIGLVRLPNLPARLQAATKPQTLGLLLVVVATALRVEMSGAATLVLVVMFQVLTAPVIAQLVGRAAYRNGTLPPEALVVDEMAAHLPPHDDPEPDAHGPDRDVPVRDGPDRDVPDRDGTDRDGTDRDGGDLDGTDRDGPDLDATDLDVPDLADDPVRENGEPDADRAAERDPALAAEAGDRATRGS